MKTPCVTVACLLLSQYTVELDSADTPSTVIDLFAGTGSYAVVSRDCSGRVLNVQDIGYTEVGGAVTHDVSVLRLRVAGGVTTAPRSASMIAEGDPGSSLESENMPYVSPTIGLNTRYFGFDAGYLFPLRSSFLRGSADPCCAPRMQEATGYWCGAMRIGREDGTYFSVNHGTNLPVSLGTGFTSLGFGFSPGVSGNRFWLGVGGIPDDGLMYGGRAEFPLSRSMALTLAGHIGPSESMQYGLAAGARIRF